MQKAQGTQQNSTSSQQGQEEEGIDHMKASMAAGLIPNPGHNIEEIEQWMKELPDKDRDLIYRISKVSCNYVMEKDEYWKKQKEFPKNDPCCQVFYACEFYNKPWFNYAAGGGAVFLAVLITAIVTSVICVCMRKK